jgi:iduronate 2-sulfatase
MAIEDLRRLGQAEKPFFLALGFIRPHLAWISPKKYWDLYDPKTLPVIIDGEVTPNTPPYALSTSYELTHYMDFIDFPKPWDEQRVSDAVARRLMHAYYASVSYVDAQLGRLLAALDDAGLADNTIIVLWSDHGWKLGEYNGWGKMSNYEIDTRVPFIIAAPGMKTAGQSTDTPVELLDIFPTLCDMAGIPTPDFVQGTSLLPLLKNPAAKIDRVAHSQYYRNHDGAEYMGYAMRTATHRFVEWREFGTGKVTARELYDHRQNHSETANVIDTAPEALVESLTSRLLKTHPRRPLQMVPAVHSNPNRGRQPAPLLIANKTDTEIKVYAITPRGQRSRRPTVVKPGDSTEINARIGGVFVVESRDGTIHEIHSPSLPGRTINIERP